MPLVALCFWIGVYPKPFLDFLHQPAARIAAIVQPAKFGAAGRARGRPRQRRSPAVRTRRTDVGSVTP